MRTRKSAGVGLSMACAAVACLAITGTLAAKEVTVAIHVQSKGLDLNRNEDAQTLYIRIKRAAYVACSSADRVGLAPVANQTGCIQTALAAAVRSIKAPLLTQIYLGEHTSQEAAAAGIRAPTQVASK